MTLTEMFTICDSCVYAPCLCGNDPENCVAYVMRTSDNGLNTSRENRSSKNICAANVCRMVRTTAPTAGRR